MKKSKAIKFEVKKTVQYWLDGAKYDIGVSESLFKAKKYPYALFMGHLAVEKLLKALFVNRTGEHAPYTHSLSLLAEKLNMEIPPKTMKKFVDFMEFHFEARYPEEQMKFYKKCTKEFAARKMRDIQEVYKWLTAKF